jgi:apolipoprotein D and lipocalin family protein
MNSTCLVGSRPVNVLGPAAPAGPEYGATGVFRVQVPGKRPPDCPGPNYIVQGVSLPNRTLGLKDTDTWLTFSGIIDYTGDFSFVQYNNFTALFILNREQRPHPEVLDLRPPPFYSEGLSTCSRC